MTSLNEIKNLITILPDKDKNIADNFIIQRKFEELKELVHANVFKTEKEMKQLDKDSDDIFVLDSKLNGLLQLEEYVDEYYNQTLLGYSEDDDPTICDCDDTDDDEFMDHLYYMYCSHSELLC